jgi:transcriptional regulator with XRE-family HTH domain
MAVSRPLKSVIGENIRRARLRQGLTQNELAHCIGATNQQVSKWEQGKHRPADKHLRALGQEFGLDYVDFFVEHEGTLI